jgi:exosortase H (IPTLxxWG-CTERM-specific)
LAKNVTQPDPAAEPPPPAKRLWRRYGPLARSFLIFLAVLAAAAALDEWANEWVNVGLSRWTASLTAWTLRLLGNTATVSDTVVRSPLFTFEVIGECTAYYPFAVFLAAVLAYPAGWQSKAVGIACGLPAVVAVNQLRLVSLAYINQWKPSAVDVAHVVVWQSLIIFLTLVLWLLWVVWTDRHARQAS